MYHTHVRRALAYPIRPVLDVQYLVVLQPQGVRDISYPFCILSVKHQRTLGDAHQGLSPNLGGLMGFRSGRVPMPRTSSMGALRTSCVQRSLNSSARHSGSGFPSLSNTFGAASPALAPASGPLGWPHSAASLLRTAARALCPSTKATCAADLCTRQRER